MSVLRAKKRGQATVKGSSLILERVCCSWVLLLKIQQPNEETVKVKQTFLLQTNFYTLKIYTHTDSGLMF